MEFKLKKFEKAIEISRIANIHYFEFTKEYHTVNDNHPFCELIYVDYGVISVKADNYSGYLEKNQMIIHKAGETHSLKCENNDSPNVIIIGFECKSDILDQFSTEPVELTNEQQKLLSDVIKEGRSVFLPPYDIPNLKDMKKRKDCPFGADQMIKLKLESFFIELVRSREMNEDKHLGVITDSKVYEIHQYLTINYKENITLEELCFLFNTNKSTLCTSFKSTYGTTIINYVNALKIKETKRLMRNGMTSITEISEKLGFTSVNYFSRLFKKSENKSPKEYLKTIKSRFES